MIVIGNSIVNSLLNNLLLFYYCKDLLIACAMLEGYIKNEARV